MREIKFRAWDKENKRMLGYEDVGSQSWEDSYYGEYDELWNSDLGNFFDCLDSIKNDENIILMQYTGLKDKNGKEIYEGDIIKEYSASGKELFSEIAYDSEFAKFGTSTEYGVLGFDEEEIIEVVGNIYENPELLVKETQL